MRRFFRYLLFVLLWTGVIAYVVYAATASRRARVSRRVERVVIDVADSSSRGYLITADRVRNWIDHSGIPTRGEAIDRVNLAALEAFIARNGFIRNVEANVSYDGTLRVKIRQRLPLVRILTDGMNAYATEEGYLFAAPRSSSLYVPIVTGSYRLPIPDGYTGCVRDYIDGEKRKIDHRIEQLEQQKFAYVKQQRDNLRKYKQQRAARPKRIWWRFEQESEYEARLKAKRERDADAYRRYRYMAQLIRQQIDAVSEEQERERMTQKKLEKSYEDFMKLLTFVCKVEKDGFWRSEVVQIATQTTPSGALELELVPRSGNYTILFGRAEEVDEKFAKLFLFYQNGLSKIGWDAYRLIDVRFKDQVVCKK